jgi:hypothetical protein
MSAKVSNFLDFENVSCRLGSLSAVKFIREMRGGTQPVLVQCDDDHHYVVKMNANPQGPNTLANEFLGSAVAGAAGLPVPQSSFIYLSDAFIDDNPELWFQTTSGTRRPDSGVHYGSRFVGELSGSNRPTDYISHSRVDEITNRTSFLGMYIMDVWANHQDSRQAILLGNADDRTKEAFFIDHGHMFGGPSGFFNERHGACHLEISVYSRLWHPELVAAWIARFQETIPTALASALSVVPPQWYNGNLGTLEDLLMRRLQNLSHLVELDAKEPQHFIHRNLSNDIPTVTLVLK